MFRKSRSFLLFILEHFITWRNVNKVIKTQHKNGCLIILIYESVMVVPTYVVFCYAIGKLGVFNLPKFAFRSEFRETQGKSATVCCFYRNFCTLHFYKSKGRLECNTCKSLDVIKMIEVLFVRKIPAIQNSVYHEMFSCRGFCS